MIGGAPSGMAIRGFLLHWRHVMKKRSGAGSLSTSIHTRVCGYKPAPHWRRMENAAVVAVGIVRTIGPNRSEPVVRFFAPRNAPRVAMGGALMMEIDPAPEIRKLAACAKLSSMPR